MEPTQLVKMVRFVLPLMSESRLKVTFTGTFSLDTHLNDSDGRGPGDWVIDIPTQEDLPPVVIPIVPDTEQQIDKQGHF